MENNVNNPLVVRCEYCGGEVSFDIAKQKYCCTHCGAEASVAEQKTQSGRWRNLRKETVMRDVDGVKSFECPACGAQTMVAGDNVTAQCPFCQNTMIDRQFAGNDVPEVIIPFKLTKEEAEAKLRAWLKNNKNNMAAKVIERSMQNFTGCYLPYHIVRGVYNSKLRIRQHYGESEYPFRAYLNHTAVNASMDLDNLFLDGIEPFNFDEALEFSFGFLNRQTAKMQNVGGVDLENRINEETQEELYKSLSKNMGTKELSVNVNEEGGCESFPALLPVYIVKCKNGIAAAVNGQTGKVSVATGKTKNLTRLWWIAPTVATLVVVAVGSYFIEVGTALVGGMVFGIIFFAIASSRHQKNIVKENISYPKEKKMHNDTKAEFFADFGKGPVPVKIKFFTLWRIIKVVAAILAIIFLPVLLAIPIQLMRGLPLSTIHVGYGAAWYCIPGFFTIVAAGGLAKSMMYGSPMYYEILPSGKTKRRKQPFQKKFSLKEALGGTKLSIVFKNGCLAIGFILFLLLGSVAAMIF